MLLLRVQIDHSLIFCFWPSTSLRHPNCRVGWASGRRCMIDFLGEGPFIKNFPCPAVPPIKEFLSSSSFRNQHCGTTTTIQHTVTLLTQLTDRTFRMVFFVVFWVRLWAEHFFARMVLQEWCPFFLPDGDCDRVLRQLYLSDFLQTCFHSPLFAADVTPQLCFAGRVVTWRPRWITRRVDVRVARILCGSLSASSFRLLERPWNFRVQGQARQEAHTCLTTCQLGIPVSLEKKLKKSNKGTLSFRSYILIVSV